MPLHLLPHPLGAHVLTHLRDQTTKPALFRTLSYQISLLLALEATRDLATTDKLIATPMEPTTGRVLAKPLVIVPILRAGLGMLQPFHDIFPDVSVGYVGLERDHQTAVARSYYCKLPPLTAARVVPRCRRSISSRRRAGQKLLSSASSPHPKGSPLYKKPTQRFPSTPAPLIVSLTKKNIFFPA